MGPDERPPTDYRGLRKQRELQLVGLAIFVLVVVGGLLIGFVYGFGVMLAALPCLSTGAAIIVALYLLFTALERWSNK